MTARNCCFTLNNWTEDDYKEVMSLKCDYIVVGKEIGESGTPHLQGYIEWGCSKRFTVMHKICNGKIHWEQRKGTAQEAANYCKEDGDWVEFGKISDQGARTDLIAIRDEIKEGLRVDTIMMERPHIYHQYGRTLSKIEDLVMRKKFRKEMTKGIWIWGRTGVGKSHEVFNDYDPDTHYDVPDDNGWWDAYTQQDTVILNDFRGEIPYNQLLKMVDKWPYSVRRRNREPMPFISKRVIVTSSLPPERIYKNREAEDAIEQLLRRFEVIELGAEVL